MLTIEVQLTNRVLVAIDQADPKQAALVDVLKAMFTHPNPAHAKARSMKLYKLPPSTISTWRWDEAWLGVGERAWFSVPRGGQVRLIAAVEQQGFQVRVEDYRSEGLADDDAALGFCRIPAHKLTLRDYQVEIVDAAVEAETCIVRAGVGSGKTTAAFAWMSQLDLPTLVVLYDGALLRQWLARCETELGLKGDDVGIVQGKKRRLRPVTLAMAQALAKDPEWCRQHRDYFGAIVADECFFEADILMKDGSLRSIWDVHKGDEVAVGGKVLRTMQRLYDGPSYLVGDLALSTAEHPVATSHGWTVASLVCGSDDMWYDPLHEERKAMCGLRSEYARGCYSPNVSSSWPYELSGWEMRQLWGDDSVSVAGPPFVDEMRVSPGVEQGSRFVGSSGRSVCCEEARSCASSSQRSDQKSVDERRVAFSYGGSARGSSAKEVRSPGGEGCLSSQVAQVDFGRKDSAVWWSPAWQRQATYYGRDRDVDSTSWIWFRPQWGDQNGGKEGVRVPFLLQGRLDSSAGEDRCGTRWFFASQESQSVGCKEDLFPRVEGVVSHALPGAVLFRRSRARVYSAGQRTGWVKNLETEGGVYVAGGALVHNCQGMAADTMFAAVDWCAARYRLGVSADETRVDGKEALVYDLMGPVACEIPNARLVAQGAVLPVALYIVPTNFRADWYRRRQEVGGTRPTDYVKLLEELSSDVDRNSLVSRIVAAQAKEGRASVVWCARREQCHDIDSRLAHLGVMSGLLIGGEDYAKRFEETLAGIRAGKLLAGVGTIKSVGTGQDIPVLSRGVCCVPLAGRNRQQVNQAMGRLCRLGTTDAAFFYLWDRHVFGAKHAQNLAKWFPQTRVLLAGGIELTVPEYLARHKPRQEPATENAKVSAIFDGHG